MYASICLCIIIVISFKITKLTPTLFCDYLRMEIVNMEGRYMRTHTKEPHTKEDTNGEDTLQRRYTTEGTYKLEGPYRAYNIHKHDYSVVNSPSVSRRTTSPKPTVSPSSIAHADLVAWGCALTGNLNSVFYDGKAAENRMIFPISVFLIIDVFPPPLEKESSNFSTRVSNPTFQYRAGSTCPEPRCHVLL